MSSNQPLDRPATLKRAPKPAADESVDPVDAPTPAEKKPATAAATPRAPKRREATFPLSTRVVQPVLDTLDSVVAGGHAMSQRAAIEEAIINYWGPKLEP